MEVRYYGPTGYAMVIMVIAPESRLQNYVDIANNMLTTCAYTAGWSTAPKEVPQATVSYTHLVSFTGAVCGNGAEIHQF